MSRAALLASLLALVLPAAASARPGPVMWCGSDEVTANRTTNLELTSTAQVRLVYATPSDGADNFLAYASGMATDAAWIDQWWQAQDATRTPRFDRAAFPGCSSRFGNLDLGFVRLPNASSYYASAPTPAKLLEADLGGLFPPRQKTLVYFDGATTRGDVCGESHQDADSGGQDAIAFVYLRSDCGLAPPGSGASAEVAAHELLHDLGAVPSEAPDTCVDSTGHVCDSTSDILYPYIGPGSTLDAVTLDVGRNDYYGHSRSWWDVRNSDWLMHLPQFTLTLAVAGSGTLNAAAGSNPLDCDAGCAGIALDGGTTVTVVAAPATGSRFAGWTGDCAGGSDTCTLTLDQARQATATFVRATVRVSVSVAGKGRVSSSPTGISCPGACSHAFTSGSPVRLVATPAKGWRFAGWSGACAGTAACTISPTSAAVLRARFARR